MESLPGAGFAPLSVRSLDRLLCVRSVKERKSDLWLGGEQAVEDLQIIRGGPAAALNRHRRPSYHRAGERVGAAHLAVRSDTL